MASSIIDQLTLKDLPKKEKIITIDPNDKIPEVLSKIFSNKISSAPVVDQKQNLIGSIGIIDIVFFSLNVCHTSQELAKFFGISDENQFVNFEEIKNYLTPDNNVQKSVVADSAQFITNYSHLNLLHVLRPDVSFREVVTALSTVHRVAIGDDTIVNYISQSEVVKLLHEKAAFASLASKTIDELKLGSKDLISVKEQDRVVEAYKQMVLHKVSGVGVINDQNQLVGQISSSDIKSISNSGEMLPTIYETYQGFFVWVIGFVDIKLYVGHVTLISEELIWPYKKALIEKYHVPEKTITVPANATLTQVLDTIVSNRLHRVFIVGEKNHANGVITLTDLIKLVLSI